MTSPLTSTHRGGVRQTFPRLLGSQLRILLGSSAVTWGAALVLVLSIACGLAAAATAPDEASGSELLPVVNVALTFTLQIVQLFAIVVGADSLAGEFARGSVGAWLTITPRRGAFFAAKACAVSLVVFAVALLSGAVAGGAVMLVSGLLGGAPNGLALFGWLASSCGLALGCTLLVLLVLAIGTLTRQRLIAILLPIFAQYVLPLLLGLLLSGPTRDWSYAMLPGQLMTALMTSQVQDGVIVIGATILDTVNLPLWGALLGLSIWLVLLVPWALAVFVRRDVTATGKLSGLLGAKRQPRRRRERKVALTGKRYRATFGRLLASELRKTWSLPSTRWILFISVLLSLAFGLARATTSQVESVSPVLQDALRIEYSYSVAGGVGGIALLLAFLAASQIAAEFETGTATTTYLAAPHRIQVVLSKLITMAVSAFIMAVLAIAPTVLAVGVAFLGRGYEVDGEVLAEGVAVSLRATLFLILIAVMCAGIAGISRRSTATILIAIVLLIVGPATLNVFAALGEEVGGIASIVGNWSPLLPWEGSKFYYPSDVHMNAPFIVVSDSGRLHASPEFGIMVTALWAALAAGVWLILDRRRPIQTK